MSGWVDEQVRALCCECGTVRTTTSRGRYTGEMLHTIGVRCVVRRKCKTCGVVTNHACIRRDDDPGRNVAEEEAGDWRPYNWYHDLDGAANVDVAEREYFAGILADAERHGEWHRPWFYGRTPDDVETELWPLGVRLCAAQDLSREDRDGRRATGVYDWWPDNSEMVVTPDERASEREVVILLRAAERMLTDPKERERYEVRVNDDGQRWLGMAHYASR